MNREVHVRICGGLGLKCPGLPGNAHESRGTLDALCLGHANAPKCEVNQDAARTNCPNDSTNAIRERNRDGNPVARVLPDIPY